MLEEIQIEIEALRQRADDLAYLMIEAEGDDYFSYSTELQHVEYLIEQKEQDMSDIMDLFRSQGNE